MGVQNKNPTKYFKLASPMQLSTHGPFLKNKNQDFLFFKIFSELFSITMMIKFSNASVTVGTMFGSQGLSYYTSCAKRFY
jgi:hypothetical protein